MQEARNQTLMSSVHLGKQLMNFRAALDSTRSRLLSIDLTIIKYRKQLTEAMKLDAFKDDKECLSFVQEVDIIFDGPPAKSLGDESDPSDQN